MLKKNEFITIEKIFVSGVREPLMTIKGTIKKENGSFYLRTDKNKKIKLTAEVEDNHFYIFQKLNKKEKYLKLYFKMDNQEYFLLKFKNSVTKRILERLKHVRLFYKPYYNEKIRFAGISLSGIIHPKLILHGKKEEETELFVKSNGQEIEYNVQATGQKKEFYYSCELTKKQKKIEIYLDDQLVLIIKNKMYIRVLNKCMSIIKTLFHKIGHLFYVFYRGIRAAWKQYHFLIPPKLWKKYWIELVNKIKYKENGYFYNPNKIEDYNKWLKANEKEEEVICLKYNPLISILIPVYNIEKQYLSECLDSILKQTYKNFEICLVDDASTKEETIETLKEYEKLDKRIKVKYRKENGHISKTSNDALKMAKGEFIGLVDNDDLLTKNALYEVVKVLNENKKLDFIYSDEDKIDMNGNRCYPHFKPDFSPDTLMSCNYICHFSVLRKKIVEEVGGFEVGLEGAQDHDLFLKVTEKTNQIYHITKILYHWRMIPGSTAATIDSKSYATDKGKIAIENALKRRKLNGTVTKDISAYYLIEYQVKNKPLVSIIIPTKDHAGITEKCLQSIYEKTTYKNFEIILVNNNSEKKETYRLFEKYKKEHNNFRVIDANFEFNYSKINNIAVNNAKGKYIVLLNNDTEIMTPNWLEIMLGYASLNHIGAVGVKLLYPDKTVQHGGVILGLGGVASHAHIGSSINDPGLYGRLRVPYNYSAVTAACLMVSKKKYEEVNGLEEDLKVAYNDIDFNIKLLEKNYYNIFLPQVELMHYESKSRGYDTTAEKYKRFLKESEYMYNKWQNVLDNDKMYNKNFSKKGCFMLDKTKKGKNLL